MNIDSSGAESNISNECLPGQEVMLVETMVRYYIT